MSKRGSSNRHVPVVVGLVVFMAAGLFGVTAAAPAVVRAAPGDVGLPGPSFAGSGADPTGTKPESKVWFNDGFWWASMYNSSASAFTIHRLSGTTWTNTGAVIDARENTHSDALWDQAAGKLYIASHVYTTSPSNGNNALLYRYSYNAGADTYALDGGFPQTINTWSSETLVIDKDSTGQLWATWTRGGSVRVNRTTVGDQTWGTEFVPAVTNPTTASDDISTIVAFGGNKIGLLWSRQNGSPDEFRFSIHDDSATDTTWGASESVYPGNNFADDHLNLKADPAGNLFAVVKTSLGSGQPNLVVLRRSSGGTWTDATYSTGSGTMTRGILAIDTTNNLLRVFATAPESNGTIYEKTSPLSSLSFVGGLGTQFIRDNSDPNLNNATTTKQTVNASTGLLVLAGHEILNEYWFNVNPLTGGGGPTPTPPTPTPPTPPPGGTTLTFNPTADAQVRSTSPTANYGTVNALTTREDANPANVTWRDYLQFNVAGLTGPVAAVKLRLFVTDVSTNSQNVFTSPTGWGETTINWNNKPTMGTTILGGVTAPTLNTYIEIPLPVSAVTGNGAVAFGLQSSGTASAIFNSKEAASNRPELVVTQVAGNQAPTASPVSKSTPHDIAATVNLAGTDAETCELTFALGTPPTHGSLGSIAGAACAAGSPNSDGATVQYTPTAGYSGPDSFTYTVSDGTNPPVSATVTMTVTNAAPTATGSSQTTPEDTLKTISLAGADADDCNLTFVVGTGPAHGSLGTLTNPVGCSGTGPFSDTASVDYTPTTGYNGPDSFTFTVSDGVTTSAPATVNITVGTPPNQAPTASPVSKSTPHDVATSVTLAGTDLETCNLTFAQGTGPTNGSLGSITPVACTGSGPFADTATVVYTPDAGYSGPDSFTYTVSDGTNPPVSATVSITVTNAGPTANGSSQATSQGTPVTFNLVGTDPDDCQLTFNAPSTTSKGTLSATGALACTPGSPNTDRASITYTPNAGQSGADSFTFTVSDGVTTSAAATVNLTIAPSGGTPTTFTPMADASVKSDSPNNNYGTDARLRTRAAAVDTPTIWRPYVRFNVTGTGTVTGVKLRLWVDTASPDGGAVYKTTDSAWTDTSLTWTTAQALTLGPVLAQVGPTTGKAGTWVEVDLGAGAVTANGTYTYAIQTTTSSSGYYSSKEGTHAAELVVTRAP